MYVRLLNIRLRVVFAVVILVRSIVRFGRRVRCKKFVGFCCRFFMSRASPIVTIPESHLDTLPLIH